jgi:hypothetical protein
LIWEFCFSPTPKFFDGNLFPGMPAFIGTNSFEVVGVPFAIEPAVEASAFGTGKILNCDWWKEVVRWPSMNNASKHCKGEEKGETTSGEHWRPNE